MSWTTRPALPSELPEVAAVLQAAARALLERGQALWPPEAVSAAALAVQYPDGQFWLGELDGQPVASMILLGSDLHFWPDASGSALYLHKLGVHPDYQGQSLGVRMLEAAVQETRRCERDFLRLDAVRDRPRLRAVYEEFGLRGCGIRGVDGYEVALYELGV